VSGKDDGTWAPEGPPTDGTWIAADPDGEPEPERAHDGPSEDEPASRYVLGAEVARGGLGRIVEAWDQQLEREVAVKQLLRPSARAEARFDREMHLTARLQHPNIVPVFDGGRLDGTPYLAMRRVHGRSLAEALDAARGLDARMRLLPHLIDVANAIAYAHDQRVVHRDLKPDNVLVGGFGETVVIDWGLAKDLESDITEEVSAPGVSLSVPASQTPLMTGRRSSSRSLTRVGSVMGTPRYMPPEQATGGTVDPRSDVYAIGAMLYELLAGQAPYEGVEDALAAVRAGPPVDVAAVEPTAPRDLTSVVRRAMAREPSHRYDDAASFAADLSRFLEGRFVSAYDYTALERVTRLVRQHPLVTGLLVVMAVGTVAFVAALERSRSVAESERAQAAQLEQAAVLREDLLRLAQARRLAETDPGESIELLAGLSDRTPFDGRVRTIFSAAMAAGPLQRVPALDLEMGSVVRLGDELVVLQEDAVVGYDSDLRERWRIPDGDLAMGGRTGLVASDEVVVVLGSDRSALVRGGEVLGHIDVPSLERAPMASDRPALTHRGAELVVVRGDAAVTVETQGMASRSAWAEGEHLVVGDSLGWLSWRRGSVERRTKCPSAIWSAGVTPGVGGAPDRVFVVGAFAGMCQVDWGPDGLSFAMVAEDTGPWNDLLSVEGDVVWLGGGEHHVAELGRDGTVRRLVPLRGAPESMARAGGVLWVGTDSGWLEPVDGPSTLPPARLLSGPVRRVHAIGDVLVANAGARVVRIPSPGLGAIARLGGYVSSLAPTDGGVDVSSGPEHEHAVTHCGGRRAVWAPDGSIRVDEALVGRVDDRAGRMLCDPTTGRVLMFSNPGRVAFMEVAPSRIGPWFDAPTPFVERAALRGRCAALAGEPWVIWAGDAWTEGQGSATDVACGDDGVAWGVAGSRLHRWENGVQTTVLLPMPSARVSVDRGRVVVGTRAGTLLVRARPEAPWVQLAGHSQFVQEMQFDPSGRYVASSGWDASVWLWDTTVEPWEGRRLRGHPSAVVAVAWGLDGSLFTGDMTGTVRRWQNAWPSDAPALRRLVEDTHQGLERGELPVVPPPLAPVRVRTWP